MACVHQKLWMHAACSNSNSVDSRLDRVARWSKSVHLLGCNWREREQEPASSSERGAAAAQARRHQVAPVRHAGGRAAGGCAQTWRRQSGLAQAVQKSQCAALRPCNNPPPSRFRGGATTGSMCVSAKC
jgi:hypothetical protein